MDYYSLFKEKSHAPNEYSKTLSRFTNFLFSPFSFVMIHASSSYLIIELIIFLFNLQISSFLFANANFNSEQELIYPLSIVFKLLTFVNFLEDLSIVAIYAFTIVLVVISIIWIGLFLFIFILKYKSKSKSQHSNLLFLSSPFYYLSIIITWVLLLPSTELSVYYIKCYSFPEFFPDMKYYAINLSILIIQICTEIIIFLISILTTLFLNSFSLTSEIPLKKSTNDLSLINLIIKFALTIIISILNSQYTLLKYFLSIISWIIITFISIRYISFFVATVNALHISTSIMNIWNSLALLLSYFNVYSSSREPAVIIVIGSFLIYFSVKLIIKLYFEHIFVSKNTAQISNDTYIEYMAMNYFQTISNLSTSKEELHIMLCGFMATHRNDCPYPTCYTKVYHKLYLPFSNEYTNSNLISKKDVIYLKLAFFTFFDFYRKEKTASQNILIIYAHYALDILGNYPLAYLVMKEALSMKIGILHSFAIYNLYEKIEVIMSNYNKKLRDSQTNFNPYVALAFEELSSKLFQSIKDTSFKQVEFWEKLDSPIPDLNIICQKGTQLIKEISAIPKIWKTINKLYPKSKLLILSYISFLEHISFNYDQSRILRKVLEKDEDTKVDSTDILLGKDSYFLVIEKGDDSAWKIIKASNLIHNLIGFRESEIVGFDIKLLLPAPYIKYHTTFIENFIMTGIKKRIDKLIKSFLLHKNGYVINVKLCTKVLPSLTEGFRFIQLLYQPPKAKEIILLDKFGRIVSLTKKLIIFLNLETFYSNDKVFYIYQIIPSLSNYEVKDEKLSIEFEKENRKLFLKLFIPEKFSEWSEEIKLKQSELNDNEEIPSWLSPVANHVLKMFHFAPLQKMSLFKSIGYDWLKDNNKFFLNCNSRQQIFCKFTRYKYLPEFEMITITFKGIENSHNINKDIEKLENSLANSYLEEKKMLPNIMQSLPLPILRKGLDKKAESPINLNKFIKGPDSFRDDFPLPLSQLKNDSYSPSNSLSNSDFKNVLNKNDKSDMYLSKKQDQINLSKKGKSAQITYDDKSFLKSQELKNFNEDQGSSSCLSFIKHPENSNEYIRDKSEFYELNRKIKILKEEEFKNKSNTFFRIINMIVGILLVFVFINAIVMLYLTNDANDHAQEFTDLFYLIHEIKLATVQIGKRAILLPTLDTSNPSIVKINDSFWSQNLLLLGNENTLTEWMKNSGIKVSQTLEASFPRFFRSFYEGSNNIELGFNDNFTSTSIRDMTFSLQLLISYSYSLFNLNSFDFSNKYLNFTSQNSLNPILEKLIEINTNLENYELLQSKSWSNNTLYTFLAAMIFLGTLFGLSVPIAFHVRSTTQKFLKIMLNLEHRELKRILKNTNDFYISLLNSNEEVNINNNINTSNNENPNESGSDNEEDQDNQDRKNKHLKEEREDNEKETFQKKRIKFKKYKTHILTYLVRIFFIICFLSSFFLFSYFYFATCVQQFNTAESMQVALSKRWFRCELLFTTLVGKIILQDKFSIINSNPINVYFSYLSSSEKLLEEINVLKQEVIEKMSQSFSEFYISVTEKNACIAIPDNFVSYCNKFMYSIFQNGLDASSIYEDNIYGNLMNDTLRGIQSYSEILNSKQIVDLFYLQSFYNKQIYDKLFTLLTSEILNRLQSFKVYNEVVFAFYIIILIIVFIVWIRYGESVIKIQNISNILCILIPPEFILKNSKLKSFLEKQHQ